ncbi:MAG: cytochrome C [Rhodospirillaceae bacterium]|nr:cytochrome C [Rhodospirillaceae bacterium]
MLCLGPHRLLLLAVLALSIAAGGGAASPDDEGKLYQVVDGKVDARTYNGFRRYHAVCNHCHGPDGSGSTVGPSLVDQLVDLDAFRRIVREGTRKGTSIMKGFDGDPNVAPYIDDIYAYLQARADGALGRGRPSRIEE